MSLYGSQIFQLATEISGANLLDFAQVVQVRLADRKGQFKIQYNI